MPKFRLQEHQQKQMRVKIKLAESNARMFLVPSFGSKSVTISAYFPRHIH